VYQKNQVVLTATLVLQPWKMQKQEDEWYQFVQDHVVNGTQFMQQFELDAQQSIKVLQNYPRLCYDYQLILDAHGNLYHLDLDRAFEEDKKDPSEKEMARAIMSNDYMIHKFQQAIVRYGKH
jgi:hypothetical protein